MAGERAPLDPLTDNDIGVVVIVVCYSLASVSVVVTIIRYSLSALRRVAFRWDDAAYVLANVVAVASTILWHLAVTAGLGEHLTDLSSDDVDKFFKFEYAAQLTEILAMLCAKTAVALLSHRVVPRLPSAKISALISIIAWAIFSLFALAFQCPFPQPWVFQPAQCPTHGKLLYPIIIFNALTDIFLAVWIVPTVWKLRMVWRDRLLVVFLFSLRLCVLFPAVAELSLLHRFLGTVDQTWITVNRVILSQIMVYVSVISAAIPRTNQFLSQIHTDRAWMLQVPDFEIFDAGRQSEPNPEPSITLMPPNEDMPNTTIYSGTSIDLNEDSGFAPEVVVSAQPGKTRWFKRQQ